MVDSGFHSAEIGLPESISPKERLASDVNEVLRVRQRIKEKTSNTFTDRLLGVVSAGRGAEKYLPRTIPLLIQQANEAGRKVDLLIGMNNGFENEEFYAAIGGSEETEVVHLYADQKLEPNVPAKVRDESKEPYTFTNDEANRNRVFIIHQPASAHAAGKIRMLNDAYGLVMDSIEAGWTPPNLTIAFDAESEFRLAEGKSTRYGENSNGLARLLDQCEGPEAPDVIGTKNRFAVYRDTVGQSKPDTEGVVPPMQLFLNLVHGRIDGYRWNPGGGTLGKTEAIVSLIDTISRRYPGMRIEDVVSTVLGLHAGFQQGVSYEVLSLNRCPGLEDQNGWREQMERWVAGSKALDDLYGRENTKLVAGPGKIWNVVAGVGGLMQEATTVRNKKQVLDLVQYMVDMLKVRPEYNAMHDKVMPDVVKGSSTTASW